MRTRFFILAVSLCLLTACSDTQEVLETPDELLENKEENKDVNKEQSEENGDKGENEKNDEWTQEGETPIARKDIAMTRAEQEMAAQNVTFAFELLKKADATLKGNKEQIVLSPMSASFALSMLANGANGQTQTEITETLGFKGMNLDEVNAFNRKLLTELPQLDNTCELGIANSLWLNKGFTPLESFTKGMNENYDAKVHEYDFSQGPAPINEWGSEKTNGRIPKILENLDEELKFLILNALYFKGGWKEKFNEKETVKENFRNEENSLSEVDMMNGKMLNLYIKTDKYAMTEFPFGNEAFCFQVILPHQEVSMEDCLASLNATDWITQIKQMEWKNLEVKLPKFKIERKDNLNNALMTMGIQTCFTEKADFSKMTNENLMVSFVSQANYLCINEEGAEAAAVTAIGGSVSVPGDSKEPEYIPFHVNRPFIYILKEKSTNSILFMGKVTKM